MGKNFVFNPDTLSFEYAKISTISVLKRIIPHALITISLGSILGYFMFLNVTTPELRSLERQKSKTLSNYNLLEQQIKRQADRLISLEHRDDNVYRSILSLKPIAAESSVSWDDNTAGSEKIGELKHKLNFVRHKLKQESKSYNLILTMVKNQEKLLNSMPAICPIATKDLRRVGSGFGYRLHPIFHVMKLHTGIDLSAERGTPVYASGDGLVIKADASSGGYGNCIRINHGYSYLTVYAHLHKILVAPGEEVKRGQLIGLVGNTGRSTSPHLHYEVRINNNPVNPKNYFYNDLSVEEYELLVSNAAAATAQD